MKVSVVICTYDEGLYDHFTEAVESVRSQTHGDVEIIVVVDGNPRLCEQATADYGASPDVSILCNENNRGLSASRNRGIERATGDVVAFLDDDAVADEEWLDRLVTAYEREDAIAAGGKMTPLWVAGKPSFLPEEFYWLIGVTHRGFADEEGEVRNTFGSNISVRRDVLGAVGGFTEDIGLGGDTQLQAEEPELGTRLRQEYGHGVYYVPDAEVAHKIFEYRTSPVWLLKRAFWQGFSKRGVEEVLPDATDEEDRYLRQLLFEFMPRRFRNLIRHPSIAALLQFVMLFVFSAMVGFGYLYGIAKW